MGRELSPEEEAFIARKLSTKNLEYDADTKVYKKIKPTTKAGATLWTLFRPRNWGVLVVLIIGIIVAFIISSMERINTILGSGIIEYVNSGDASLKEIADQSGIDISAVQDIAYIYDNSSLIIAIVLAVGIITVGLLFGLDVMLQSRRDKRFENLGKINE